MNTQVDSRDFYNNMLTPLYSCWETGDSPFCHTPLNMNACIDNQYNVYAWSTTPFLDSDTILPRWHHWDSQGCMWPWYAIYWITKVWRGGCEWGLSEVGKMALILLGSGIWPWILSRIGKTPLNPGVGKANYTGAYNNRHFYRDSQNLIGTGIWDTFFIGIRDQGYPIHTLTCG